MAKAIGYMRVSGKAQVEGDGFPRQREAIEQWARNQRVEIVGWYQDEGVSGTIAERPALARMLVDLERNHVDVRFVVVEKVDRLARELFVQESIIRDVAALDREVVSAVEGDLSGDPTRQLVRQIMGAVAEYEKKMVVQKLAAARARTREREGRCEGRKPFGDRPGEQETLARMRDLRKKRGARRLGYRRVAATLNQEGRSTRSGKPWRAGTVRAIIQREFPALA